MKKILVTGCSGFIGFHLCKHLIKNKKYFVFGIDNMNSYYDVTLKNDRLSKLNKLGKLYKNFKFKKLDITNKKKLQIFFQINKFDCAINLAAQAGVRHSIEFPETYLQNNVNGFFNILESSRKSKIKHLIFASTSSVYGANKKYPFVETDRTDNPESFYAATKKTNEIMAYTYSSIYNLPVTGLRFFTVYGDYGRPDMALFKFTKLISISKKIPLFNKGNHVRDFTHVDDVVLSIEKLIFKPSRKKIPFDIFNIASSRPISLKTYVSLIEYNLGLKAKINNLPFQQGDVFKTYGDNKKLKKKVGFSPKTSIDNGISSFVKWYQDYFNNK